MMEESVCKECKEDPTNAYKCDYYKPALDGSCIYCGHKKESHPRGDM
jgi:hypothetical protein